MNGFSVLLNEIKVSFGWIFTDLFNLFRINSLDFSAFILRIFSIYLCWSRNNNGLLFVRSYVLFISQGYNYSLLHYSSFDGVTGSPLIMLREIIFICGLHLRTKSTLLRFRNSIDYCGYYWIWLTTVKYWCSI